MGGERDGSVSVHGYGNGNGNANAPPLPAVYPPATTPVVAANGGSGSSNTEKGGGGGLVASSNTRSPATPAPSAGFQSFPSELLSRLLTLRDQNVRCPHGATTNITLLVQFVASQFPAFSTTGAAQPTPASCGDHNAPKVANAVVNPVSNASPACNLQAEKENRPDPGVQANNLGSLDGANNAKRLLSGATDHGNSTVKPSSCSPRGSPSSSIGRSSLAPQSEDREGVDNELLNGGSDLVFSVKRRSKKRGVGPRHVKMSDLHACFHLKVADAAKKLGVSQTTLKYAWRKFGMKRWPGRKVRGLQSTIHGLEHAIAVGQGYGFEGMTDGYMRSEVYKLHQDMDQLVYGTPAQITQKMLDSPDKGTADVYKHLYRSGWRSKSGFENYER